MRRPHWYDQYQAAAFFGDLLETAIEVTKIPNKPKPRKTPERPKPDKARPVTKG